MRKILEANKRQRELWKRLWDNTLREIDGPADYDDGPSLIWHSVFDIAIWGNNRVWDNIIPGNYLYG